MSNNGNTQSTEHPHRNGWRKRNWEKIDRLHAETLNAVRKVSDDLTNLRIDLLYEYRKHLSHDSEAYIRSVKTEKSLMEGRK